MYNSCVTKCKTLIYDTNVKMYCHDITYKFVNDSYKTEQGISINCLPPGDHLFFFLNIFFIYAQSL